MSNKLFSHETVLLHEAVQALAIDPAGIYIDGTFGRGGHSREILRQLNTSGRLIAYDKDPEAVMAAQDIANTDNRFSIMHDSFCMLKQTLADLNITQGVNGILLDLGVSSPQLDDADRGFSFSTNGMLDMRMDTSRGESAREWLSHIEEQALSDIIKKYGEERFHRRIANAIVEYRKESTIEDTATLAKIIAAATPFRDKHKHPATRTFQAIRIAINRELEDLEEFLSEVPNLIIGGGRLVTIAFHSLEDRPIKNYVREQHRGIPNDLPMDFPVQPEVFKACLKPIGKPVRASEEEIRVNPRSRSAIMRITERVK
ncbi:16S rRNA (cytosine(1402)-N(4))-methyltransferase [hydrothermal vent metagenome]|uniref:16S rRNA (Cytosine(1402)-N(4))-methyltransferase n=1 Tax=hydrothermal vent metagenome TaxID=652676 RepID=A0A3B0YDU7_9ZZZZ